MINKRGDGYISTCVMIVVICMLLSVFVTFAVSVNTVKTVQRNSRVVLDSFVMKNSIVIYDSVKNGNNSTAELDEDMYTEDLCDFCTFEKNGEYLYAYTGDGKLKYKLSKPIISFATEGKLKINASYTVYYPIDFAGVEIDTAEIPVTVESKYNEKF